MCEIPKNQITHERMNTLRNDKTKFKELHNMEKLKRWPGARFICVFAKGDLNTAAYLLAEYMHHPFDLFPMASLAVEESISDDFLARVRYRFRQLKPHVALHPNHVNTLEVLHNSDLEYIIADKKHAPHHCSPIFVKNINHLHIGGGATGVVTVHTFETVKEAADIFVNDTPVFDAVHLFDESISTVYAFAARVSCIQFYVNCLEVTLLPIMPYLAMNRAHSLIYNGYHYETIILGNAWKIIVFPISTQILKTCCCMPGRCRCLIGMVCCE